jgi:hypothetical protein
LPEEVIPPTPEALQEALQLSEEILKDIELSRSSLSTIALKTSRLARLLNLYEAQQIFQYEAGGYPSNPDGVPPEIWKLIKSAGRAYQEKDPNPDKQREVAFLESIEELEQQITSAKIGLEAAKDRDISISSANPNQFVSAPIGNVWERNSLRQLIAVASKRLSSRRALIHQFVSRRHYELKFSDAAQNVFSKIRETVDRGIGELVPTAVQKFISVHDNLRSENPEDWSNAVHSCRRILQDLADAVFPPRSEERTTQGGGRIKLGPDQYINRLVCFAEDNSRSERFKDLVGSHLRFLGDRLDAVFEAAQKGSHAVVRQEDANRYVV